MVLVAFALGGIVGGALMWWWAQGVYKELFLHHVLLEVLAERPNYSYGLTKEIEGRFPEWGMIGLGTLYTALSRLEQQGVIRRSADRPPGLEDAPPGIIRQYWEVV